MKRGAQLKRSGFERPSFEEAVKKAREAQERQRLRVAEKRAQTRDMEQESNPESSEAVEKFFEEASRLSFSRKNVIQLPEDRALESKFRREVRKRDGNACQYPGCGLTQPPRSASLIDVHHKGTRKRRPDLIVVATNGICLCNRRTETNHHGWVHDHPIEAVEMGLLSDRSYELAAKEGTLGHY